MQNGLDPRIGKSIVVILTIAILILSGIASATYYVKTGYSIQSVIDAANPGQTIEVQNGTFHEMVNITKTLTLKGMGKSIIDAEGIGTAVTISANGSTLMGFTVTGSGKDAKDAGIKVLSDGNIIKNNTVVKNDNYGIILYYTDKNAVFLNTLTENKNGGILLVHSNNNQIWGNYAGLNWNGITLETSRGNTIMSNNFTRNKMGINISNINISESIKTKGKGVSISYVSGSPATSYKIGQNSTNSSVTGANILYQNNLLNNGESAFDNGHNEWDNGKTGNHYSNYDAREQGCNDRNRDGICDTGYSIPGGNNIDGLPKASPDAILSYKSKGLMGSVLKMDHRTFMPGRDLNAQYVAPGNFSGWVGIMKTDQTRGKASQDKALSYQNMEGSSGTLKLRAPAENGSYDLRMYNTNGDEMNSLNFRVSVPGITATPASVNTCEEITVSYAGAPGYENDWIAMYKSGSSDSSFTSRQYLGGKENGTVILDAPDPGMYDFRIFENDSYTRLAISSSIEVKVFKGNKVTASPNHVAPGGTVTVSYWGAPPEGTAIIGMYGMNRPDKFPVGKRPIGAENCGRMTWQLPAEPGSYDFRMFRSDITDVGQGAYQLLGQSNVVTVS